MADVNAWLLDIGSGMQAAVAENEIVEYLVSPRTHRVPLAPPYCASVVFWRNHILPVFDLARLSQSSSTTCGTHLCVLVYQTAPKKPLQHLAITLQAPPERIVVSDDDACGWPEAFPEMWTSITRSMFRCKGAVTAVLDIEALCAVSGA